MFEIHFTKPAFKELKKFPELISKRIYSKILELSENPFGSDVKKLSNSPYFRLRVGDYRIIFDIKKEKLIIIIIQIAHRKKIYK